MKNKRVKFSVVYVVAFLLLAVFFFVFREEHICVWPKEPEYNPPRIYTDSREEGFSTAEFFESDSAVALRIVLNSGIYHPHAGVEFPMGRGMNALSLHGVDFSNMDSVIIRFRASSDIALVLGVTDPVASHIGDPLSLRPLRLDIPATRYYTEHRLSLAKIRPNKIWFDIHGVEPDSNLYMNHVVQVAVETGRGTLLGLPSEIEISHLEFFGPNRFVIGTSLVLFILFTGLYILGMIRYGRKKQR